MPYSKVPRFIELPRRGEDFCLMFLEDVIKANLYEIFVGYEVDCSYCCKTSRDADVFVDDVPKGEMIEVLKQKVKKRKIGAICRFVYDRNMPDDFLAFLMDAFGISEEELVPGDKHLNLQDLTSLPNPNPENYCRLSPLLCICRVCRTSISCSDGLRKVILCYIILTTVSTILYISFMKLLMIGFARKFC